MTPLLLLLAGAAVGAGLESVTHRRSAAPAGVGTSAPPRRRRRGRRLLRFVGIPTLVLLVVLPLLGWLWATSKFNQIDKIAVGSELNGSATGTNYLLVGTDNREGVPGNRSDTMLILRTDGDGSHLLSLPRDLLVTIPGQSGEHRLNAAYNDGPTTLVRTVQQSLGIPVDRYLEINFVSFAGLVDALGGVTLDFPHPAFDPKSGLDVQQSGPVELNGEQALAYVRSRTYTEVIDGQNQTDPTADIGRVKRQQQFLRAVLADAGGSRNPFRLAEIADALSAGLKIDDDMTLVDALRFAWRMGRMQPQSVELPTTPTRTSSGASVLLLVEGEAEAVLARFRS